MNIKDFHDGKTAYLLRMYTGKAQEPKITERTIAKVGRQYVTDDMGYRYKYIPTFESGLVEERDFMGNGFLFPSFEDAEKHIEKHKLVRWLTNLSYSDCRELSLEQLQKIKAIFDESKRGIF